MKQILKTSPQTVAKQYTYDFYYMAFTHYNEAYRCQNHDLNYILAQGCSSGHLDKQWIPVLLYFHVILHTTNHLKTSDPDTNIIHSL
jgi:hypothetical protein